MNEQEVREFEENIVKGANIAFQRLVNQKKKEDGELVFSRNGHIVFMGAKWKITSVEVQYPRLILTVGGVYNEQTT